MRDKILEAIRKNCLNCAGGSKKEVEKCPIKKCPLYPYRLGVPPKKSTRTHQNRL